MLRRLFSLSIDKKKKFSSLCLAACLLLTACGQPHKAEDTKQLEQLISQQLDLTRNKDDKKNESILIGANTVSIAQFKKETTMADYLLKTQYQNDVNLKLSLRQERNKKVLAHYINQTVASSISDTDIETFHKKNIERWQQIKVGISRVLFIYNDRMPESKKQAVLQRANAVKDELLNQTLSFEDAIDTYSEVNSQVKEPDVIRTVNLMSFDKATQEKLLALKPGEFMGPVRSPQGFELIQLKSDFDITNMPLAMVKDSVYQALLQNKTDAALKAIASKASID